MNDNGESGTNLRDLAASIKEDFRHLITALSHEIELIDDPESELMATMWKAKFVAERGLRLSQQLSAKIGGDAIE